MRVHIACLSVVFLVLAACGSDGGGGGSGGSGGSGGNQGQGGQGGDSGDVQCFGGTQVVFPTFDKSCAVSADCSIQYHQINCCGTLKAIGMNSSEVPAFTAAEAKCTGQYPACGCASGPTETEDGKSVQDMSMILITCDNGACNTSAP